LLSSSFCTGLDLSHRSSLSASKTWRKLAARQSVAAVGDKADAFKQSKYADKAAEIDMDFGSIVLYTYGGFHRSALSFINKLADSVDTATCLLSRVDFKKSLLQHIAIAMQRGNADIMIQDSQRQRESLLGRSIHRWQARTRPPAVLSKFTAAVVPTTTTVTTPVTMDATTVPMAASVA
jgi:hypothetical protein